MTYCLMYKGQCVDVAYMYLPEPSDTQSSLVRRCAKAIDAGADTNSIRDLCLQAGQTEEEAYLTYLAAQSLSDSRLGYLPLMGT